MYRGADQAVAGLSEELALAVWPQTPAEIDVLVAELNDARDDVRVASKELQQAIAAAAEAGKANALDKVLEDVISATLQNLMSANEHLFARTQALVAAADVLRTARLAGEKVVDTEVIASATEQARNDAHAAVAEMRERWDRVAQDVFEAFVERLAAERTVDEPQQTSG
jgi:hypothetical protein